MMMMIMIMMMVMMMMMVNVSSWNHKVSILIIRTMMTPIDNIKDSDNENKSNSWDGQSDISQQ